MPIASPCIGICIVDTSSVCIGCRRTLEEIAIWSQATEQQKRAIVDAGRLRGAVPMIPFQTIESHVQSNMARNDFGDAWYHFAVELCRIQNTLKPKTSPRCTIVFDGNDPAESQPQELRSGFSWARANAAPTATPPMAEPMKRSQFMAAWKIGVAQSDAMACGGIKIVTTFATDQSDHQAALSLISVLGDSEPFTTTIDGPSPSSADQVKRAANRQRAIVFRERADWKGLATEIATYPIIAMAGLIVRSGQQGIVIIIDNAISAAAAMLAERIYPGTARMIIAVPAAETICCNTAFAALNLQSVAIAPHSLSDILDSIAIRFAAC